MQFARWQPPAWRTFASCRPRFPQPPRCAATLARQMWATPRFTFARRWQPLSRARCTTWTPASILSAWLPRANKVRVTEFCGLTRLLRNFHHRRPLKIQAGGLATLLSRIFPKKFCGSGGTGSQRRFLRRLQFALQSVCKVRFNIFLHLAGLVLFH